jgi:hypothetical protein
MKTPRASIMLLTLFAANLALAEPQAQAQTVSLRAPSDALSRYAPAADLPFSRLAMQQYVRAVQADPQWAQPWFALHVHGDHLELRALEGLRLEAEATHAVTTYALVAQAPGTPQALLTSRSIALRAGLFASSLDGLDATASAFEALAQIKSEGVLTEQVLWVGDLSADGAPDVLQERRLANGAVQMLLAVSTPAGYRVAQATTSAAQ